jgi:hypothetical protein
MTAGPRRADGTREAETSRSAAGPLAPGASSPTVVASRARADRLSALFRPPDGTLRSLDRGPRRGRGRAAVRGRPRSSSPEFERFSRAVARVAPGEPRRARAGRHAPDSCHARRCERLVDLRAVGSFAFVRASNVGAGPDFFGFDTCNGNSMGSFDLAGDCQGVDHLEATSSRVFTVSETATGGQVDVFSY